MSDTASTSVIEPLSLDRMRQVMEELKFFRHPTEWMLISPDGKMWKANPEELLKVLRPHHPLLKGTL